MTREYPTAYYQLQVMLKLCRSLKAKAKDKGYISELIFQLENQIELYECANIDDNFTGDQEDLEGCALEETV